MLQDFQSLLTEPDNRRRVADDIYRFYDCLSHESEPIVAAPVSMAAYVHDFPSYVQEFIENCSDKSLSRKAISALYTTIVAYESNLPEDRRLVSTYLPRISYLHAIIKALGEEKLYKEKWRRAFIDLNDLHFHLAFELPISRTGIYRCPLLLLKEQLSKYGI